ncbi:ImmA/IrrE family metallo-endopeptidase [Calorimonas adulescens]|uniref:ImmA/IrrE family metallo-endopeptidase n=1 Tax=Calorimonas adulescens TaxID=2606906 RepID=UPI003B84623A
MLKASFNTKNPFKIAKKLGIEINFCKLHPSKKTYILRAYKDPYIFIDLKYSMKSQIVFCAHELGHAIL